MCKSKLLRENYNYYQYIFRWLKLNQIGMQNNLQFERYVHHKIGKLLRKSLQSGSIHKCR